MSNQTNVLLITTDQQHFSTLGFLNPKIKTPNLDRLAREGMNFNRAYTNNPVCTPSRATIITGMYPAWHGAWTIGCKLPEDTPTVGDEFQKHGYATHLIGKAHFQPLLSIPEQTSLECQPTLRDLDFWREFTGPWYGFERIELARNHGDESHAGQHYAIWMEEKGLKDWPEYFQYVDGSSGSKAPRVTGGPGYGWREDGKWEIPRELHYTYWTGERTCANIEEAVKAGKPFFTWSSFHDPHPPYVVPEPYASMYDPEDMEPGELREEELEAMIPLLKKTQEQKPDFSEFKDEGGHGNHGFHSQLHDRDTLKQAMAIYYGMMTFIDDQVGRILDKLDELGVADDTLIVFSTDHGHFLGQHGLVAKAFMYEDDVRVPFIVRWPGKVPAGSNSDALQGLVDLAPTFLKACGIDVPGRMQGVDQLPVWTGAEEKVRDNVIVEHRHQPTKFTARSYIDDRYKLTLYRGHEWGELFDLQEDPGEFRNLWDDPGHQQVKAKLLFDFAQAEMEREPTVTQRIAGA